ncbi:unnamed protein product [Parascedosporium putredinis]|uniref:Uncharacterized protein n=1 Tax=Parascedosporium putredinis TaxID=1442378 RepID=A0A9P1HB13_9PEZI|nr:unnamed protein product [Parascedosporium putredinis]CAI8003427.1 unnamed protein product [Parascedosporium putredinis]
MLREVSKGPRRFLCRIAGDPDLGIFHYISAGEMLVNRARNEAAERGIRNEARLRSSSIGHDHIHVSPNVFRRYICTKHRTMQYLCTS